MNLNIVLMKRKLMLFKIENEANKHPDADADQAPTVTLLGQRIWKGKPEGRTMEWNSTSEEFLEQENPSDLLGIENSNFVRAHLQEASSMTIAPIFVQLDDTLLPDTELDYKESPDYEPNYDDVSFTGDNMAARPLPGGSWFYHIFIVHKSKAKVMRGSPPVMSVLRILENGTMVHLLTKVEMQGKGQFENPELRKDVTSMTSLAIGRQSYLLTSSSSIDPTNSNFPHEEYSVVEAFKLEDDEAMVTRKIGKIGYLKPEKISEPVATFNAVKVVKIDFYSHVMVAILDSVDAANSGSRLRVFNFKPNSELASQVFSLAHEVHLDSDSNLYTAIHSFEHQGLKYLTVSRPEKAIIYQVESHGALKKVSEFEGVTDLDELVPVASGRAREDAALVLFGNTGSHIVGKQLLSLAYPWSLEQATSVSEPIGDISSGTGSFALLPTAPEAGIMGVHLGLRGTEPSRDLSIQIFLFPEVPEFHLDHRLQKEAEIYPRLYSIPAVDSTIIADVATVTTELNKYVAKSGSIVSGAWNINSVKAAKMTAFDLPEDTMVTLKLKDNRSDLTTEETIDFRRVFDLDLAEVESKLQDVNTNLGVLDAMTSDLLLKDSPSSQTVNTPVIFDGEMIVSGELSLADVEGGELKIGTLKNLDETESVTLDNFANIYSANQNNVTVGGNTIFKSSVVFNGGVQTSSLSEGSVTINVADALRYSGGQTISANQMFNGPVIVAGNLSLEAGVGLSKGDLKLLKADIPYDGAAINKNVLFSNATAEDPGLTAPHFSYLSPELIANKDHIAPKSAASVHIKGKLKFAPEELDLDSFTATGVGIGLVKATVNGHNVSELFDNAAWLSAPDSREEVTSSTVMVVDSKFDINELQMVQMPQQNLNISSTPLALFARKANPDGVYKIGGDKTFVNITDTEEILAKTFNIKTLDQFVTKHTEQNISMGAQFNAGIKVQNIVGFNGKIPLVDSKNLTEYFSNNLGTLLAMEKNLHFNTITVGPGATIMIDNLLNSYNLKERSDNIVRTDATKVEISGNKLVPSEASLGPVKVDRINTAYSDADSAYQKSYELSDFVNMKNPQTIYAGKSFSGGVTLGDVSFLGSESLIQTKNGNLRAPPLTNCFIDVNSEQEFIEINRKVSFETLNTDQLHIVKGK